MKGGADSFYPVHSSGKWLLPNLSSTPDAKSQGHNGNELEELI